MKDKAMKKKTILIVEDNEAHRFFLREVLESEGYNTIDCSNGIEALEILKKFDNDVDIITLDWSMPGMDGDELLRIIRSDTQIKDIRVKRNQNPKIPVVMITVFLSGQYIKEMRKNADYFLPKPLNYKDLLKAIRTTLKKYGNT